jgi:hypothetical protein
MRTHKFAILISGAIAAIALFSSLILNRLLCDNYWIGILQGVFGSAVLIFVIEIINYLSERRNTLDDFSLRTRSVLRKLNVYDRNLSIDKKVEYFLSINDNEFGCWDELGKAYASIDFMFDWKMLARRYIFASIYEPLEKVKAEMVQHSPNFRWHLDGLGHNDDAMKMYIDTIESMLFEVKTTGIATSVRNIIVHNINAELFGRYYEIQYGKRKAEALRKEMQMCQEETP